MPSSIARRLAADVMEEALRRAFAGIAVEGLFGFGPQLRQGKVDRCTPQPAKLYLQQGPLWTSKLDDTTIAGGSTMWPGVGKPE